MSAAVLAALIGLTVVVAPSSDASPEDELAEARRRIEAVTDELDGARASVEEREAAVEETAARVRELEQAVNAAAAAVQQQRTTVGQVEDDVAAATAEVDRIQQVLAGRARGLYKRRMPYELAPLLSGSDSITDVLDGMATMGVLNSRDRASVESLDATRARLREVRGRLEEELASLDRMEQQRRDLLEEMVTVLERRREDAAAARARAAALDAQREDLEAESQELEELIARQRAAAEARARAAQAQRAAEEAAPPAPAESSGSGYVWPVCGPVTSEYGYRWGRRHTGIDIDGSTGDAVYAAKAGGVIYTGRRGGYGNLVLVEHPDGVVTAYAHLSSISVGSGQTVARGQVVGAMGSTGNSTGSHLHFETRPGGGDAVNPRNYLPSGC